VCSNETHQVIATSAYLNSIDPRLVFCFKLSGRPLSIPIWRYRSALKQKSTQRPKRVDPFYAVRVLLLAKASALAGVLFASWHLGVVIFTLSGAVVVQSLVLQNSFGFIASVMLIVAALITEQICRLPQDSDPDPDQAVTS